MKHASVLAICTGLLGAASTAVAADLPRKAPAPMVAPMFNWTGFYVGAHAGWTWGNVDGTGVFTPAGIFTIPAAVSSIDADGGMLGEQIGFNYQFSSLVVGLEADISWTDVGGSVTSAPFVPAGGVFLGSTYTAAYDMDWFGTVRGRLGFAASNFLIYATGGFASADLDHSVVSPLPGAGVPGLTFVGTEGGVRTGWTLGAGIEWGFAPNWSLKGEYLYYDLGDVTVTATTPLAINIITSRFENDGHILRLGVNYRFGTGRY